MGVVTHCGSQMLLVVLLNEKTNTCFHLGHCEKSIFKEIEIKESVTFKIIENACRIKKTFNNIYAVKCF